MRFVLGFQFSLGVVLLFRLEVCALRCIKLFGVVYFFQSRTLFKIPA